jgi:hypothetical protein
MDLTTITMPKDEAQSKFEEYRASVRRRHNREDEQIMRGYRALARGQQIIDLPATIRQGGTTTMPSRYGLPMWLPQLAIMRADQPWCHARTTDQGRVEFHHLGRPKSGERRNYIPLPAETLTPPEGTQSCSWWTARAMVPPVPPALRPADNIGNYHILWEAEWQRVAPKDPALLKHISGDLYAVLAVWDLTELERAVLAGRFAT